MNFADMKRKYRSIVDDYRKVIHSESFVVDDFQNGESYSKCLLMTILDFAQSIAIASSNKDFISPPLSLRGMSEAYIKLVSLREGGLNVNNFELSGLTQRSKDVNSFLQIVNEDEELKEEFADSIERCTNEVSQIEQGIERLREIGAKDINTANLFSKFKMMKLYRSSYRQTNTFVHSDIFSLEHRHMNEKNGVLTVTPTVEKEEGRVAVCMTQGALILLQASDLCSDLINMSLYPANLDSRVKSFVAYGLGIEPNEVIC